eukprot:TRINITY_DN3486_c0_g1_i1.p2 TRINITY_DN3486_c0_g1~~TRINITY_DN3486_c0_g1_i1.p2  ORF type:complete len:129 (+),score=14.48 TRINITY_DN3486_c0_g1_i1:52-438(+)
MQKIQQCHFTLNICMQNVLLSLDLIEEAEDGDEQESPKQVPDKGILKEEPAQEEVEDHQMEAVQLVEVVEHWFVEQKLQGQMGRVEGLVAQDLDRVFALIFFIYLLLLLLVMAYILTYIIERLVDMSV